jgi:chromosome segregation ATPase
MKQSAEDRTTAVQATVASTTMERDSLVTRLAQAAAEVTELRAAVATANDGTEKATAAAVTAKAAARDTAKTATKEKTMLEAKVAELEQELVTVKGDLITVNRQFTEASNKLQEVTNEASQHREDNSKLLLKD